jgi:hypothetical protein
LGMALTTDYREAARRVRAGECDELLREGLKPAIDAINALVDAPPPAGANPLFVVTVPRAAFGLAETTL